MPRVLEIESLVKLCVHCIRKAVENIKLVSCPSAIRYLNDNASTPFHQQLPVVLLEEIIESFTSSKSLIHPLVLDYIIRPQIQHLSFPYYSDVYMSSFPKLGNLLILDLDNSGVGDYSLKCIGIYCSKLRSLNLKHCLCVTDIGIQWLCGVDNLEMENGKSGLCKTVTKLSILYTRVTQQGIQVVLKYLLALNILENYNTVEALVELAQSAKDSKQPGFNNKFSISTLYTSPYAPYRSESLQLALSLCHSVNHVSIHLTKGLKDSDLLCLRSIKILRKLKILGSRLWLPNETEITFDGGVAPLLRVFGKSLETLALEGLDLVRISVIIDFCPNLNVLYISDLTGSLENERNFFLVEKKPPIFKYLKFLFCVLKIPVDILLFLLSSPSLEHIAFCQCDALSDEVLLEAVKYHRLKNLRKLGLEKCHSVTKHGIIAFLINGCNPLEIIDFNGCANIRPKDCTDLLSLIAKKNWNLNVSRK